MICRSSTPMTFGDLTMAQQTEARIDVRQAITNARAYIKLLYSGETLQRLMLEGVELTDDERNWIVTFGFDIPAARSPREALGGYQGLTEDYERTYRDIIVDAATGEARKMEPRLVWMNS